MGHVKLALIMRKVRVNISVDLIDVMEERNYILTERANFVQTIRE